MRPANGLTSDLHDMQLTGRGTALLLSYDRIKRDLRFVGGVRHGRLLDNVVQEVDLATGLVLFEWHSVGEVPLTASRTRPDGPRSWDYFHVNSVEEDTDGNLIISARNTCALYKLDRATGDDRLAARRQGRRLQDGQGHALLLPARRAPRGARPDLAVRQLRRPAGPAQASRALVLGVDETAKTVRLVRQYEHPGGILRAQPGLPRVQPNGNVFVGWGAAPVFSEFSASGKLLFDGRLTRGKGNYRAIRESWTGARGPAGDHRRAHPRRPRPGLRELERRDRGRPLAGARRLGLEPARRGVEARDGLRDGARRADGCVARRRARAGREREGPRHLEGGASAALGRGRPPLGSRRVAPARDHVAAASARLPPRHA